MSIDEYRKQFIDNLRFDAEHEGTDPESQFINKTLEHSFIFRKTYTTKSKQGS